MTAICLAAVCAAVPLTCFGAEAPAIVTLIEGGGGALLRGTSRYALAEGVRLQSGDIVELGDKGVAQIEFADGVILNLGPRTRLYAGGIVGRVQKGGVSDLYLMQGWGKIASGKAGVPSRYNTPMFGLGTTDATVVVHIADGEGAVFLESGEVRIADGFTKAGRDTPTRLRAGEFYFRKADQKGVVLSRPAPAFVTAMPKSYMDNLPSRAAKYKDREVPPRATGDLAYADVELYLKAPPEIRRAVMQRFISKAHDPAFRQALVANLRFHPEWDPILFPEKYKPKPPPDPPAAAPATGTAKVPNLQ